MSSGKYEAPQSVYVTYIDHQDLCASFETAARHIQTSCALRRRRAA